MARFSAFAVVVGLAGFGVLSPALAIDASDVRLAAQYKFWCTASFPDLEPQFDKRVREFSARSSEPFSDVNWKAAKEGAWSLQFVTGTVSPPSRENCVSFMEQLPNATPEDLTKALRPLVDKATKLNEELDQLIKKSGPRRTSVGLEMRNTSPPVIADIVINSPAHKAGLAIGDVILTLDGQSIDHIWAINKLILAAPAGKSIVLGVRRESEVLQINVVTVRWEDMVRAARSVQ